MKIKLSKNKDGNIFMNISSVNYDKVLSVTDGDLILLADMFWRIIKGPCDEAIFLLNEKKD